MSKLSNFINRLRYGESKPSATSILMRKVAKSISLSKGIHVGAHWGEERQIYARIGFASMLWVEASPEQFAILTEKLGSAEADGMQDITINAFASDAGGTTLELRHFSNDGASSSVFRATELLSKRWPNIFDTGRVEAVKTSTLDSIARENGFTDADFLNVDVQGA